MSMNRELREQIVAEVRRATIEAMEIANERWMTADELCKQFGMFSPSWLKTYGERLPRQRAEVMDDGKKVTRWAYPQHRIARMINEGAIKQL